MIILGIIGGVASGKSLVCEQFHQLGAEWIQADRDGHAVALDEAQARYRALFEQSHDAVFILDLQGKYIDVNRRATDMLGYAKEEIQRLSLADLSVEPEENQQIVTRLLRGKSFPPFEAKGP